MDSKPNAPFRAEVVGSLLRPARLKQARAKRARGEITAAELRASEDACIADCVRRQESVGLQVVTDGEQRRENWNYDFTGRLSGVEIVADPSQTFVGSSEARHVIQVNSPIARGAPIFVRDFEFLRTVATLTPKISIPAPAMLYYNGGRNAISADVYPDLDAFWSDVAGAYQQEIRDLAAAGCRYLQIDDVTYGFLCDPGIRASRRQKGDNADDLPAMFVRALNQALSGRPAGMVVGLHTCRGNKQSSWIAAGGYEPVAEELFQNAEVDAFFLEYDSERAGSLEPLRYVPKGKKVVLGLVSTKSPVLETADSMLRKIREAEKFVALDHLSISPQCGFASTQEGNNLTEDEQWRKLELVVKVAAQVWR